MAAPSNTKWGSTVGDYGRIGISLQVSHTNTQTTVVLETWFWSKYSISDSNNSYYYTKHSTSATGLVGSRTIKHTVNSGSGWSTSNQTRLGGPSTYTYNRGTGAQTYYYAIKFAGIERVGGTMYATASVSVPAKAKYTVTFVNGYGGTISTQTVYYGGNASPPGNPSRTGYTFAGWSGSYTNVTSNRTITATWTIWTYSISYNANGGSGAPGTQYKNYGSSITLSGTRPTRSNYNFLGWSTSASGGVVYNPGSTYSANANVTLYAVWQLAYVKPRISGFTVSRCDSAGNTSESGTYGKVSFSWSTDRTVSAVYVQWRAQSSSTWSSLSIGGSGTSASVSGKIFGSGGLSADVTYIVRVYVSDSGGTTYSSELSLGTIKYPIDVKAGGTGIAFGKVAENANMVDIGWLLNLRSGLVNIQNGVTTKIESYNSSYTHYQSDAPNGHWFNKDVRVAGNVYGGPNYNKLVAYNDHQHSYATWCGGFYMTGGWIGLYGSYGATTRKGWLGHDGGTTFYFYNETGGNFYFNKPISGTISTANTVANGSGLNVKLSGTYAEMRTNAGIQFVSNNKIIYFEANKDPNAFRPGGDWDNQINVGIAAARFRGFYGTYNGIASSDRNIKKNIETLDERYEKLFMKLVPVRYMMDLKGSDRYHTGLIAQDVKQAMDEVGISELELAAFCKDRKQEIIRDENDQEIFKDKIVKDGEDPYQYSLRYADFVSINIHMIQKLYHEMDKLKQDIINLKGENI